MVYDIGHLPSQSGRIAIVTGSNTGLGFHNARDLAAKGAKVVMACRTESRARAAMDRIAIELPEADLEFLPLDLQSLDSVRAAAVAFRNAHESLDLLINNAGIMMTPYTRTVDGFEGQMAANYWGHFLLTMSLIDLLPDASDSRVVSLSSLAHRQGSQTINFDDIHWERRYSAIAAYRQTKLACLMFALELDRRLQSAGKQILSVSSHPGISDTELGRSLPRLLGTVMRYTVGPLMSHDPDQASLPTLLAAIQPGVAGGAYFGPQGRAEMKGDPGPATLDDCARDEEAAHRLWERSVELTGADLPF